jgi:hypothetical protein
MEILSDICVAVPEVIDKMPSEVWGVLSDWFLEYPYVFTLILLFF